MRWDGKWEGWVEWLDVLPIGWKRGKSKVHLILIIICVTASSLVRDCSSVHGSSPLRQHHHHHYQENERNIEWRAMRQPRNFLINFVILFIPSTALMLRWSFPRIELIAAEFSPAHAAPQCAHSSPFFCHSSQHRSTFSSSPDNLKFKWMGILKES